ncbi:uncharacterized protein FA14DRAFT_158615 [Meira miltonrushii]|uniref:Uncharacterized protein n=1 Tax=Meira miltonrushii TaxID=1280837 RepID=A0A316V2Q1_9BASI|nr:uncharacterized protein FA14DRAFT_158615 [Meira miltonrushii]PWN31800.1 hypothetical protein FA14DRAFT_158615 [Meira miltonrushii]
MRHFLSIPFSCILLICLCSLAYAQVHLVEEFKPEQPPKGDDRLIYLVGPHRDRYNVTLADTDGGETTQQNESEITCGYKNNNARRVFTSPCQVKLEKAGEEKFMVRCSKWVKEEYALIEFEKGQKPAFSIPSDAKHVWAGFTSDSKKAKLRKSINGEKVFGKQHLMTRLPTLLIVSLSICLAIFTQRTVAEVHLEKDFKPEQPPQKDTRFVYLVGPDRGLYNISLYNPYDAPNSDITCGYTLSKHGKKVLKSPCQTSVAKGSQEFKVTCQNLKEDMAFISFYPNEVPDFSTAEEHVWAGFTSDPPNQPLRHSSDDDIKGKAINDSIIVNCANDRRTPLQ